jgi:alkylation response protein AidB-like acyl-CoA dehydrogenase
MADDLLRELERIRPTLTECGAQAERDRRLPDAAYDAMLDAGLFRMLAPKAYGGLEQHPGAALHVFEALSRIDSSAAWNLCISSATAAFAAWLPKEGGDELYERGPDTIFAGGFFPPGPSVPVPGGWRVTARTAFASGCQRAQWFAVPLIEVDDESTKYDPHTQDPPHILAFVPRDEVDIVDTWHTVGMRGTFSADVCVDDVFVPERRIARLKPRSERAPAFSGPLYGTLPWFGTHGESAVSLGIAAAAIERLVELAVRKTPRYTRTPLHDRARAQHNAAKASALVDASRVFLHSAISEAYADAERQQWCSDATRIRCQLAACFGAQSCAEAVDLIYEAAGTSAIRVEHGIERHYRDVHTITQHVTHSYARYEDAGRLLFGLPPDFFLLEF